VRGSVLHVCQESGRSPDSRGRPRLCGRQAGEQKIFCCYVRVTLHAPWPQSCHVQVLRCLTFDNFHMVSCAFQGGTWSAPLFIQVYAGAISGSLGRAVAAPVQLAGPFCLSWLAPTFPGKDKLTPTLAWLLLRETLN
jgi:hypothetical protein